MNIRILISAVLMMLTNFTSSPPKFLNDDSLHVHSSVRFAAGQIISVSDHEISIHVRQRYITLLIDDDTHIRDLREGEIGTSDLQVGRWIVGFVEKEDEDNWVARLIVVLPEDFEPVRKELNRRLGIITEVNVSGNEFVLSTNQGEKLRYVVSENTRFRGQVSQLTDLKVGMVGLVFGHEKDDGSIEALGVAASQKRVVTGYRGYVIDVDYEAAMFTLVSQHGGEMTFVVDEHTYFYSREGSVQNLADLTPGMMVFVAVRQMGDNGSLRALHIVAGQGN